MLLVVSSLRRCQVRYVGGRCIAHSDSPFRRCERSLKKVAPLVSASSAIPSHGSTYPPGQRTYGAHKCANLTFRHSHWVPHLHLQPYILGLGLRQRAAPPTCQPRPPVPAFVRWLWRCPGLQLSVSSSSAAPTHSPCP